MNKLVSIIIPSFNREKLIVETLHSVINQTYTTWECLVIDDGSADNSVAVVNAFAAKDNRITCLQRNRQPKGAPTCRNIGIDVSKGEYMIFLDADDILSPTCLENRVSVMEKNPVLDFAVFPRTFFKQYPSDSTKTWNLQSDDSDLNRFLKFDWWLLIGWLTTSPIWRKDAVVQLHGFDETLADWQDWDIHVRAIISGLKYEKMDVAPDWYYRLDGADKISKAKDPQKIKLKIAGRATMLTGIVTLLKNKNMLTPARKKYIQVLYYNFITEMLANGHKEAARQIFGEFRKVGGMLNPAAFGLILKLSLKFFGSFVKK